MDKKVIVAEDYPHLREAYVNTIRLNTEGVEVEQVADGDSLVDRVRGGGFSLIFTDNDMPPGMDGIRAIKKIREFDERTPIYLLSANQEALNEALGAGATGFILKNRHFTPELKKVIAQYLG